MNQIEVATTEAYDNKVRSGSAGADSGQSSSPELNNTSGNASCSNSIADSLEDQPRNAVATKTAAMEREVKESQETIENYISDIKEKVPIRTVSDEIKPLTPTPQEIASAEQLPVKQPLKSALVNSNVTNNNNNGDVNNFNNHNGDQLQIKANTEIQQKNTNNANNNFSGLNLNMTASEMRELLAKRKKFDPKKAQMNIRQKYEIIQQM